MAKVGNDAMEWIAEMEQRDATFRQRVDKEMAAMRLEQQLVELRQACGLSQTQLARILGVSQQAIAKAESGQAKNVELRTLLKHVLALGGRLEVTVTDDREREATSGRRRREVIVATKEAPRRHEKELARDPKDGRMVVRRTTVRDREKRSAATRSRGATG